MGANIGLTAFKRVTYPSLFDMVILMVEDLVLENGKGELRILGRRYAAIDVGSLCKHLEGLVGEKVAEVIIDHHEIRLGDEDAASIRREKPEATIAELVEELSHMDRVSGIGVTNVILPNGSAGDIALEISNPILNGTKGAEKALILSYWCGALSCLLGRKLDVKNVVYDEEKNALRCEIGVRVPK